MKIKEFLTEAVVVALKDLPDWVKEVFKETGTSFSSVKVFADQEPKIGGVWHDADVVKAYFYVNGKVVKQGAASYDSLLNSDEKERALYSGVKVRLWDEPVPGKANMVLITHTYPKMAELFVHPNQMPKSIDSDKTDLTDDEKKVLLITKGYTSSYRGEYFKRYDVKNVEAVKKELIRKGLLTTAGAINVKGKNEVEKLTDGGAASSALAKLFGYGR